MVQLYIKDLNNADAPIHSLKGFSRIYLKKGEIKTVSFRLKAADFSAIAGKQRICKPCKYKISIGGKQPNDRPESNVLIKQIKLVGKPVQLEL